MSLEDGMKAPPRRKAWLAFLLGVWFPGLGHLYLGQALAAGAAALLVCLSVLPLLIVLAEPSGPVVLIGAVCVALVAQWASAVHAALSSRGAKPLPLSTAKRRGIYLAYAAALSFASQYLAIWYRENVAEGFRIPSSSMVPTLLDGDHLLCNKRAYLQEPIERGDVVVFHLATENGSLYLVDERPSLPRSAFVKRVVGIPGDRIRIQKGSVVFNGQLLTNHSSGVLDLPGESLTIFEETLGDRIHRIARRPSAEPPDFPEVVVPPGRYLLMGDHRDNSYDSRYFGAVPREDILGKVAQVYFAFDPSGKNIDWHRIGAKVE